MNGKSKSAIAVLFGVVLFLAGCATTSPGKNIQSCKECTNLNEDRWVTAKAGLVLRDNHDKSAQRLDLIPLYAKVHCTARLNGTEKIGDVSGSWIAVEWDGKTGWVFGGYLAKEKPVVITPRLKELQDTALEYYRKKKETAYYYKRNAALPEFNEIKIQQAMGNFAVVVYYKGILMAEDISPVDAVWRYTGRDWVEVATYEMGFGATLLYINNDSIPDYISSEGCCNNSLVTVVLGTDDGGFSPVYNSTGDYAVIKSKGPCGKTVVTIFSNADNSYEKWVFSCRENTMVLVEKGKGKLND